MKQTRLDWVGAFCRLPRQHDAVGAIQDSIRNVADFRTRWARVILHMSSMSKVIFAGIGIFVITVMDCNHDSFITILHVKS